MDFGEYVKTSRSGVVLCKVLFCFLVNKFIVEHAFNVFSNSFFVSWQSCPYLVVRRRLGYSAVGYIRL